MRWLAIVVLCSGCAVLPSRTACLAVDGGYTWVTKSPKAAGVTANCWGDACPTLAPKILYYDTGHVQALSCEPVRP